MSPSEDTLTLRARGLKWRTIPEFADTIPLLPLEELRRPAELPDHVLVKDSTTRTVARYDDPQDPDGPGLYLKRYKFRDLTDRIRYAVVPSKPATEWRISRALREAGIPTCDVLAFGLRTEWGLPGEGFLASREISGTVPLKDFIRDMLPEAGAGEVPPRDELIEELARLTARLVDARFYHRDYHAGNLLIRPHAPEGRRLFVTDLHAVRRRTVRRRRLRRMLAMLGASTASPAVGAAEQVRFLRAFLRCRRGGTDPSPEEVGEWARRVRRTMRKQHRRHMRSRTRRCLVESSLFTSEKTDRFVIHRRRDFPRETALSMARLHRRAIDAEAGRAEVLRRAPRTEVTLAPCPSVPPRTLNQPASAEEVGPGPVCVKAYLRRSRRERLKDCLRLRSRARAAWVGARGLHVRGIPAPLPLALLESRRKLRGSPDYLITRAVPNDGTLDEYVSEHDLDRGERLGLVDALADLLITMAQEKVYHPDTKPGNILVQRNGEEFELYLVDLDRVQFEKKMSRRRWIKSLARVNSGLPEGVSGPDRMRCLRRCAEGRWDRRERLELARRVREMSIRRRGGDSSRGPSA